MLMLITVCMQKVASFLSLLKQLLPTSNCEISRENDKSEYWKVFATSFSLILIPSYRLGRKRIQNLQETFGVKITTIKVSIQIHLQCDDICPTTKSNNTVTVVLPLQRTSVVPIASF